MLTNAKKDQDLRDYARVDAELTHRMSRAPIELARTPGMLNYIVVVALTLPILLLAVLVGLFEKMARTDGRTTLWMAIPFLWAADRRRKVSR